ncbi:MAG: hypothetical protein L6Q54_09130 [Leptospiraceae bacterium]|nr:hypothetical protein [Leptospiraceae bacterium]MCK6381395.1 hypothetical protein [Leptospiraceae bacterium]NUM42518.1 hypothetical protein [Leptospiraceae bacterium]
MKNQINRLPYFFLRLILVIFIFWTNILRSETEKQFLEWKPIEGAYAYKVEVRDQSKKIIIEKIIKTNKIDISLSTGNYEHRIGVLNKFSKVIGYSNWNPISVVVAIAPFIETKKKILSKKGDEEFEFSIGGKYFFEETKVKLASDLETIQVNKTEVSSDGKNLKIFVNLKNSKPGAYDLILENPKNKISKKTKFFLVQSGEKLTKEEEKLLAQESKVEETDPSKATVNYKKSFWGAMWRSAILPGWGLIYGGEETKGYAYMGLFAASILNVYVKRKEAVRQGRLYTDKQYEDYAGQIFPSIATNYPWPVGLTLHNYHQSQYSQYKNRYNESLRIAGGLYLLQFIHSLYSARNYDKRMWSVLWRAAFLPGWGQLEAGNKKTGYSYLTLFTFSVVNFLVQTEKLQIEKSSYNNNLTTSFGVGLLANQYSLSYLMEKKFQSHLHRAERIYHQSINIVAAIYGIQLLHSFFTGNAYENTTLSEYTPGKIISAGLVFSAVPSFQTNKFLPNESKLDYNVMMLFTF